MKTKTVPKSTTKKSPRTPWNDEFIFRTFELAKAGQSDSRIAKILKLDPGTFRAWTIKRPILKMALNLGRETSNANAHVQFRDYVYRQLSPEMKTLWDEINRCEKSENGLTRLEELFGEYGDKGQRVRQHMFLYALVDTCFNASEACRKIGISYSALNNWMRDPDFAQLMDEIHWHKGNYFEGALVHLISKGDTACTIFANRTFNKDRGYGDSVKVQMNGKIDHQHQHVVKHVNVLELNIPIEVKRQLLAALREKQKADSEKPIQQALPAPKEN